MTKRKAVIANDEDDDDEFIASDEEKPKLSINQVCIHVRMPRESNVDIPIATRLPAEG
jgi:hypothetical protein